MPVDFLTAEQEASYGRFVTEPSPAQLARYFYLDKTNQARLAFKRTEPYLQLGFALPLGTLRFLGLFLDTPLAVPESVIAFMAEQLNLRDWSDLRKYATSKARFTNRQQICKDYGYKEFTDPHECFSLLRWLYVRAWLSAERPSVLFDSATARLIERKVVLPGVTTLSRLVARVRDQASERLWRRIGHLLTEEQDARLLTLLDIPSSSRFSRLELLRRAPTRQSTPALIYALQRLTDIRGFGVNHIDVSGIPPARLKALARYAATAWVDTIRNLTPNRRLATLFAFAYSFEAVAMDDALDVLVMRIADLLLKATREDNRERLRTIRDLDAAAIQLSVVGEMLLDPAYLDPAVRAAIFARISPEQLQQAVATVQSLTRHPDDHHYEELVEAYLQVRRFLPTLLRTVEFQCTPAGQGVLNAVHFLKARESQDRPSFSTAPLDGISSAWQRLVRKDDRIDKRAYTLCAVERLHDSLQRHDLFVSPSEQWGDVRIHLLQGIEWETARPQVCRILGRSVDAVGELGQLSGQLDDAYARVNHNLPTNANVRIQDRELVVSNLDKLEEPESLVLAREQVDGLMPWIDLPELVLEIQARTNFAAEFVHISEGQSRVDDLSLSICAVLVAEACNVGLGAVADEDNPALTLDRLAWIQQNYIRADTIARANARLVEAQTHIPLARAWGGGEVASADGLRFIVPVRTLNARPNSAYFGAGRGVTYFNYTSDQFTGFNGILIPGTLRDSLYILEGLLEQQTILQPVEIMTDTASYSDVVFGLFWLLGYQFSPRLADIGEARFWRINPQADYGILNGLARHKANTRLITQNWDDFLRVAGSLTLGTVHASSLMRSLQSGDHPSTLSRAIAELGRIVKTLYLLSYIDDEAYRRRILTQLNRGEGRHSLSRAVFHGQRGELRQRYREGQEDRLSALGLVTNAIVLWNTLYMDAAIQHLHDHNLHILPADLERLSPLGYAHINLLGHYSFSLAEVVLHGQMRPLRTPKLSDKFQRALL